jgi:hypothetical protein
MSARLIATSRRITACLLTSSLLPVHDRIQSAAIEGDQSLH